MGWPLVGREGEFSRVSGKLAGGTGLLIVGEAGVGKTRLARSGIDAAYARGVRTEWIAGAAGASGVPLAAVAHLIPDGAADEGEPTRLIRSAAAALAAPPYTSLLIGLDDAHLVDAASATVVHHALVNGNASMLATVRRGEVLPEPIEVLVRDGRLERLDLSPLSDDEVATLLVSALDGPVDSGTVEQLCSASQGNPMLVRELLNGGLESGSLVQRDGLWIWEGPFAAPRLRDLVDARLRRLSPEERAAVEVVAAGAPLPIEVAESVVTADLVAALDRAGLLDTRREGDRTHVRLAHPLYSEVLRATTSPLRRRTIHRELADAFAGAGDLSYGDVLRIVAWRLDAGDANDIEHLRLAARRALGASDFELAERIAWEGVDRYQDDQSRILVGFALAGQGRIDDAHAVLVEAARGGRAKPPSDLLNRALDMFFYGSRTTSAGSAVQHLEQLIAGVDDWPPDTEPFVEAARAGVLVIAGELLEAWTVADRVLASGLAPPSVELRALIMAATAAAMAGRANEALAYSDRGLAMLEEGAEGTSAATDALVELDMEPLMLAVRSLAHRVSGRLDEARAITDAGYRRYLDENNDPARGLFALATGQVTYAAGDITAACTSFREAVALLRRPPALYLVWALGYLAQAAAVLGDVDTAEAALAEAAEQRSPTFQVFDCDVRQGEAWTAAAKGDLPSARQHALDAAAQATAGGIFGFAAFAAHDAARLGAPGSAALLLDDLSPRTESPAVHACARHARALADRDGDALSTAADDFEALGLRLLAAEAAAEAANAFATRGRTQQARAASARARTLSAGCGPVRTPALVGLDRAPVLSEREGEIAQLAAAGLTSRAIAARLHLSVRTVDNHLHHTYEKLGIAGRDELAAALQ